MLKPLGMVTGMVSSMVTGMVSSMVTGMVTKIILCLRISRQRQYDTD